MSETPWTWYATEPEQLARYVVHYLFPGTWLLPPDAMRQRYESPFLLAEQIYENLYKESIDYDVEPLSYEGQRIRQPHDLLRGQKAGNCLDLTLLYAGLCIAVHLRPLVVLCTTRKGTRHALVLLTSALSNSGELRIWGELPGARGWFEPTWEQLRGPLESEGKEVRPVELTRLTPHEGREHFHRAWADGMTALRGARDIRVLDIYHLQKTGRVAQRDDALSLHEGLPGNPAFDSSEIPAAYAGKLDVSLPTWDMRNLSMVEPKNFQAETTLYALKRALMAKGAFESVDGTRPGIDRLRAIYAQAVGWPSRWKVDELMLVEAAAVQEKRRPTALARFLLGVAGENEVELEDEKHAALRDWLKSERVQRQNALDIMESFRPVTGPAHPTKHWAIIHLGHEGTDLTLSWEREVWIEVVPPLGSTSVLRGTCACEEDMIGTLKGLLGRLVDHLRPGELFVVDIVAPRHLMEKRYEHEKLIEYAGARIALSPGFRPRLRWAAHVYHDNLWRGLQQEREQDADPRLEPLVVPRSEAENESRLTAWLDLSETKARSILIAGKVRGRADTLRCLLESGQGRILWYVGKRWRNKASGLRDRWNSLRDDLGDLPEKLVEGVAARHAPVVIWNDLAGRDGWALPSGRPQSPRGGEPQ